MDFLHKFVENIQWARLAAMSAVLLFIIKILQMLFYKLKLLIKPPKISSTKSKISILINSEEVDNVILSCITYSRKINSKKNASFGKWEEYKYIRLHGNSGVYVLDKNDILQSFRTNKDSYNLTLEIPNNVKAKEKYFSLIAFQGYIITGRGCVNSSDENRWLIYFVLPDEPYHISSGYTWELKNSLLNKK